MAAWKRTMSRALSSRSGSGEQIISVANEPAYAALSPSKIVPKLADNAMVNGAGVALFD